MSDLRSGSYQKSRRRYRGPATPDGIAGIARSDVVAFHKRWCAFTSAAPALLPGPKTVTCTQPFR